MRRHGQPESVPMRANVSQVLLSWAGAGIVALIVALATLSIGDTDRGPQSPVIQPGSTQPAAGTPGWINVKAYGARGNGVSDDGRAIQAALDAAKRTLASSSGNAGVHGATVYFPRGDYLTARPLNADNSVSVVLQGDGSQSQGFGTLPASDITYTGSGSGSFLLARSSEGFAVRGLGIDYKSSAFSGNLIDFSHAPGKPTDAAYMTLQDCQLSGPTAATARSLVSFYQAILGSVRNCHLQFARAGITGKMAAGKTVGYANAIEVRGCTFDDFKTAAIMDAGEGWAIEGNWFEGTNGGTGGMPRAYSDDLPGGTLTSQTVGLSFTGNWFGDAVAIRNAWIFTGATVVRGLNVTGNFFSGGPAAVSLPGNGFGISIAGNFMGTIDAPVDLGRAIKDGVSITGNSMSPNVPQVANVHGHRHLVITANSSS